MCHKSVSRGCTSHDLIRVRPAFESLRNGITYVDLIGSIAPYALATSTARIFVGVADTNVLLLDLAYAARTGNATNFMHALRSGFLRVYASETVRLEVLEKIHALAGARHWDPAVVRSIWYSSVEPWLWFMDPRGLPPASPSVAVTYQLDPDDGETAQLVEMLNPDFVFSRDYRHLQSFQLVGNGWNPIAEACRFKFEHDLAVTGAVFAAGATGMTLWLGARETVRLIERIDGRILATLGLAAAIALCFPKSRTWLRQHGSAILSHVRETTGAVVPMLFAHYFAMYERSVQAEALLHRERRGFHRPRRLRDFATAVLARVWEPLTLEAIATSAAGCGYRARGTTSSRYLQSVLQSHPQLFRELSSGHWCIAAHRQRGRMPAATDN